MTGSVPRDHPNGSDYPAPEQDHLDLADEGFASATPSPLCVPTLEPHQSVHGTDASWASRRAHPLLTPQGGPKVATGDNTQFASEGSLYMINTYDFLTEADGPAVPGGVLEW